MGVSTARKLEMPEQPDGEALAEKRRRGLRMLMAAIWHRHNPATDIDDASAEKSKRQDYLAEIW